MSVDRLEELQAEAKRRGLRVREESIFDDHPYNSAKVGWRITATAPYLDAPLVVAAGYLQTAYEQLLGPFPPSAA